MGKANRGVKEFSKEQELKHENRELRKENDRLGRENRQLRRQYAGSRKQYAKMDLDRHSYVRDIIEEHLSEEKEDIVTTQDMLESMKNEWKCEKCNVGYLEILVYSKLGNPHYFRQCSNCVHRTKSQEYHDNVKGIVKEPTVPEKPDVKKKLSFKLK